MKHNKWLQRMQDEFAQAWVVATKDVRVYYLAPPMIMFGLLLPFFLFASFSIKREIGVEIGMARLLALTTFFTASSAGPVIIPMERRTGTYDRLLVAPMSEVTLLLGKTIVGAFFAVAVSLVPLVLGLLFLRTTVADSAWLAIGIVLASLVFSAFGLVFGSIPTSSATAVGSIMMPSTLVRWPLLFISGVFVPLAEMVPLMRIAAYLSPLTYAQDLINYAVLGVGYLNCWLDLLALWVFLVAFLLSVSCMHRRIRQLGY